jgi:hypothetical protein
MAAINLVPLCYYSDPSLSAYTTPEALETKTQCPLRHLLLQFALRLQHNLALSLTLNLPR